MDNEFLPHPAVIRRIVPLSPDTKLYHLEFKDPRRQKDFTFQPGQFVELSLAGLGEAPISLTSSPLTRDHFQLCIKRVGRLTDFLDSLGEGRTVAVRGPYGNGFPLEQLYGFDLVFVAGGIGLAPLRSLITTVLAEPHKFGTLQIFYGARNPDEIIFREELEQWQQHADVQVTVDRGDESWQGPVGYVSQLVEQAEVSPHSSAVVCGPPAMFKPTVDKLREKGVEKVNVSISAERRMKCGIGKCGNCIAGGEVYVCLEGPVFTYEDYQRISGSF